MNQTENRVERVIKKKGDKVYVKWVCVGYVLSIICLTAE